jgi:hypothetical protein
MKHSLSLVFFLVIVLTNGYAQQEALLKANDLYAKGQFEAAAAGYESILLSEGVAPELYYNLGNAYFKSNELGKAILNYERALRLAPDYADAKHNLEFANLKVVDNIDVNDEFFLKKWFDLLVKLRSSNGWFYFGGVIFILTLLSFLLFVFGRTTLVRKLFFYIGLTGFIITVSSIVFSGIRKQQMLSHDEAVVLSGVVVVKSAPDKSGTDLYQLHEGTKVTVISILGDWFEVKPGNGNVGWVEVKHLEKI